MNTYFHIKVSLTALQTHRIGVINGLRDKSFKYNVNV